MKKTMILVSAMIILMSTPLLAQDYPKAEVFGGFSLVSVGSNENFFSEREQGYGFQANAAFNFHQNVGIVADFGGQYKSIGSETIHAYEFLFGPRFSMRGERATVFGQALFGGSNIGVSGDSINGFAMGFGGGVYVNVNDRFAVRVIQFDWVPSRYSEGNYSIWMKNVVRFGFGIVIK
jgi:hypothetical protein